MSADYLNDLGLKSKFDALESLSRQWQEQLNVKNEIEGAIARTNARIEAVKDEISKAMRLRKLDQVAVGNTLATITDNLKYGVRISAIHVIRDPE